MVATHRVKSSDNETLGFVIEGKFFTVSSVIRNIDSIDNLRVVAKGVVRANKKLCEIPYATILETAYNKECLKAPFRRDIQKELSIWRNKSSRVLQLMGARQVGKTSELLKFAYKNYERVIYVNLANDVQQEFKKALFENNADIFSIVNYCISKNIVQYEDSRKSILIIDEIQSDSSVYNMIRLLRENLQCDIVVTGSYMGHTWRKEFFKPAGTIDLLTMYPMSFAEFADVFDSRSSLEQLDLMGSSDAKEYEQLESIYNLYRTIGGYPEVVKEYTKFKDINKCMDVIDDLLYTFKEESKPYLQDNRSVSLFESIYGEILKYICSRPELDAGKSTIDQITKAVKISTHSFATRADIIEVTYWMQLAGIIGFCDYYNPNDSDKLGVNNRVYFFDCGIVTNISRRIKISDSTLKGMITEIFTFSELYRLCTARNESRVVQEYRPAFSKFNMYELDFVITDLEDKIYGIEVKTKGGSGNNSHKSLTEFRNKGKIDKCILAKETRGGKDKNILTIPIYTVGCRFPYRKV